MQGFPGIFCYILGVKVTDLVSLTDALLICVVTHLYFLCTQTFLYCYNRLEHAGYFAGIFTAFSMVSAITWSVFVGVSRVLDRRHHVIDVVAGALWGFSIAVIVLITVR